MELAHMGEMQRKTGVFPHYGYACKVEEQVRQCYFELGMHEPVQPPTGSPGE